MRFNYISQSFIAEDIQFKQNLINLQALGQLIMGVTGYLKAIRVGHILSFVLQRGSLFKLFILIKIIWSKFCCTVTHWRKSTTFHVLFPYVTFILFTFAVN